MKNIVLVLICALSFQFAYSQKYLSGTGKSTSTFEYTVTIKPTFPDGVTTATQEIFFSNGAGYAFGEIIPDYLLSCALGYSSNSHFYHQK